MASITLNINKEQRGPLLLLDCTINCFQDYNNAIKSKAFKLDNLGMVQLNFCYDKKDQLLSVYARRYKLPSCDVKMSVNCPQLGYTAQWACANVTTTWGQYEEIGQLHSASSCKGTKLFLMKISITAMKEDKLDVYSKFYKDTELVDFTLSAGDGSGHVKVHRLILSACSEVFKTMLNGEWKETVKGEVTLEGVTVHTLERVKDFLYMGVLPEIGLLPLLLFAMTYQINSLKKQCVHKIARTVTSWNLYKVLEFAGENNIPELTFAVLCIAPSDVVHAVYQSRKNKKSCEIDW